MFVDLKINHNFRHPTAVLKPEKGKRDDLKDVNDIIKKILKQQTHLRSHIKKLEDKNISQPDNPPQTDSPQQFHQRNLSTKIQKDQPQENERNNLGKDREREGKGYIMKTFLENVDCDDFYSHDSGIGSALATITDLSISKESEMKSLDTVFDDVNFCEELPLNNLSDCLIEIEKIIDLNEKIVDNESRVENLYSELNELSKKLKFQGKEEYDNLLDEVESVTKINSSKSHEIKKNDISISHMEKNLQGRQIFLNTIELDINRAESYAKRLQKEFEREFETVGLCNDILTVCNGDEDSDETPNPKVRPINDEIQKCDISGIDKDVVEETNSEFKQLVISEDFTVSATDNHFGSH